MAVYFDEVPRYHLSLIEASIYRGLDELAIDLSLRKSAFIKVNIVRPAKPDSCVVTHPVVVRALIKVLKEHGLEQIIIGDGPAAGVNGDHAFKRSGYLRLAEEMEVRLLDINGTETVKVKWDYGSLDLPVELLKSDLYINVAKMKTHFHTGVTLSIKNQQGLLSSDAKKTNHRDHNLHESLYSIAKVVKPDLAMIDGIHSMEGEGPTKGTRKKTQVLIYGDDMLETDIACCHFMGVSPFQVQHLSNPIKRGLASAEPNPIGSAFSERRTVFKMPSPKPKKILNFYSWKNYRACAEDEHSFEEAIHLALRKPKYWLTFFPKFLYMVLFKRFHLLRGRNAKVPEDAGRILCIGNCCQDVAEGNDAYFVPGCPPKPEDIVKAITRMR